MHSQNNFKMLSKNPSFSNENIVCDKKWGFSSLVCGSGQWIFIGDRKNKEEIIAYTLDDIDGLRHRWQKFGDDFGPGRPVRTNESFTWIGSSLVDIATGEVIKTAPPYEGRKIDNAFYGANFFVGYHYENQDKKWVYAWAKLDADLNIDKVYENNICKAVVLGSKLYGVIPESLNNNYWMHNIVCFDFESGCEVWRFDCQPLRDDPHPRLFVQVQLSDNKVFFKMDCGVVILDAKLGQLLHHWDVRKYPILWDAIVHVAKEKVVVEDLLVCGEICIIEYGDYSKAGENKRAIAALNWRMGEVLWVCSFSYVAQLALAGENAVVGAIDGYAMALDLHNGKTLWRAAKPSRAGRFVEWNNGALCLWSNLTDRFEIYLPAPEGATELDTSVTVAKLQQKITTALLPSSKLPTANPASALLLKAAVHRIENSGPLNVDNELARAGGYEAFVNADLPLAILFMEQLLKYYPDLDDPNAYVHEILRIMGELLLEAKAVLKFDLINKAARYGCDGYVTSLLMELAELTKSPKREALYKWAVKECCGNDYVLDANERLHGRDGL